MASYNNKAMNLLDSGPLPGEQGDSAPPANDVESINIRKAGNGWIVDVSRERPANKDGGAEAPSKPEKPQLAKSSQDLIALLTPLIGGATAPAPEEEEAPPADNLDASADNEREGVDAAP
jgi:hypothetical protein